MNEHEQHPPERPYGHGPQPAAPEPKKRGKVIGIILGVAGGLIAVGAVAGGSSDQGTDGDGSGDRPAAQEQPADRTEADPEGQAGSKADRGAGAEPAEEKPEKPENPGKPESGDASATLPDLTGKGLQAAQDRAQEAGFYGLTSHDATGQERLQMYDRNWTVCSQEPGAGRHSTGTVVDFGAVKEGESCP
ncbi:hypothetical protein DVA86_01865 [Streptomyces armeniacus]|uniref:PASTA domain-containing protein n=1 Tax=Streptomyces armeniacus TaxID=83291 RepID=A0A345XIV8_9ACTN|nr:PASTA domain-containing protein [Streptomyces armeniacus]AXK31574.1 hypothetical protein DVA86_01865 [Streptomyces armeniacus]